MKNYIARLSAEVTTYGKFYVRASAPASDITIAEINRVGSIAENSFLKDATMVLEKKLSLKKSNIKPEFNQIIQIYENDDGIIVELVDDDFHGIMIESKNKEIIQKIYQELVKLRA